MAKRFGRPSLQYRYEHYHPPELTVMVTLPNTTPSTERAAV